MATTKTPLKLQRRQVLRHLALWSLLWVMTEALVVFGHRELWGGIGWLTGLFLTLNVAVGLAMVWTYRRLMGLLDELERKIQLESMGITLGLTLVVGVGYSVLDITNLIAGDAEIGILIFFMAISYIVSILVNTRRYC